MAWSKARRPSLTFALVFFIDLITGDRQPNPVYRFEYVVESAIETAHGCIDPKFAITRLDNEQ